MNTKEAVQEIRQALDELMPFVLEDYHPTCAQPAFKRAVKKALDVLQKYPVE